MKLLCFTIKSFLLATVLIPVGAASAVDHFYSQRQRTRTKCYLPDHDYDHDAWPFTTPGSFKGNAIAVAATDPTSAGRKQKPFHFRALALTVGHISLDQVGITLYKSDGRLFATGRINNNGGDGGIIGNNVVIRLKAYASYNGATSPEIFMTPPTTDGEVPIATPNDVLQIPPDSYRVWTSEHKLWVSRGVPHDIRLAPSADRLANREILARYFDEITHLEVELEYRRDR